MRRVALTLLFALSIGLPAVLAGEALSASSSSGGSYTYWLPNEGQNSDGCGSDGDPDNPTVDQPQTRGNREGADGVVSADQARQSLRASWEVWLTRLLQLMGIR